MTKQVASSKIIHGINVGFISCHDAIIHKRTYGGLSMGINRRIGDSACDPGAFAIGSGDSSPVAWSLFV